MASDYTGLVATVWNYAHVLRDQPAPNHERSRPMRHLRLVAALLVACAPGASRHQAPSGQAIRDSLTVALRRGATTIPATQFAPGEWTALFIFGPYTSDEAIRRCTRATSPVDGRGIDALDNIDLLVFRFRDGNVVSRAVPHGDPVFAGDGPMRYVRAARFRIGPVAALRSSRLEVISGATSCRALPPG